MHWSSVYVQTISCRASNNYIWHLTKAGSWSSNLCECNAWVTILGKCRQIMKLYLFFLPFQKVYGSEGLETYCMFSVTLRHHRSVVSGLLYLRTYRYRTKCTVMYVHAVSLYTPVHTYCTVCVHMVYSVFARLVYSVLYVGPWCTEYVRTWCTVYVRTWFTVYVRTWWMYILYNVHSCTLIVNIMYLVTLQCNEIAFSVKCWCKTLRCYICSLNFCK